MRKNGLEYCSRFYAKYFLIMVLGILFIPASKAQDDKKEDKLRWYGDFRFRGEHDWDSWNSDSTMRDDRSRMRYRFRLGLNYQLNQHISAGGRLRTGVPSNIQSPHVNVGYVGFSSLPFQLDKAFISVKYKKMWGWVGKNSYPFWKQNELFWDDDVNPEGLVVGSVLGENTIKFKPTISYFITNHQQNGGVDGTMGAGQLTLDYNNKKFGAILSTGYYQFDRIFNVPEADDLYTGNRYRMNYKLLISGVNFRVKTKVPIALGFDYTMNLEDYSDTNGTIASNYKNIDSVYRDQLIGYVISAKVGKLKEKGDWLLAIFYAYKEKFSVVDYYVEDDWVRWGNINRNRNTNYAGFEFRAAYAFSAKINLVARTYSVESIVTNKISKETGNRFRLDLNVKF